MPGITKIIGGLLDGLDYGSFKRLSFDGSKDGFNGFKSLRIEAKNNESKIESFKKFLFDFDNVKLGNITIFKIDSGYFEIKEDKYFTLNYYSEPEFESSRSPVCDDGEAMKILESRLEDLRHLYLTKGDADQVQNEMIKTLKAITAIDSITNGKMSLAIGRRLVECKKRFSQFSDQNAELIKDNLQKRASQLFVNSDNDFD